MSGGMSIGHGIGLDRWTGAGVPANALRLNGQPITLNGHFITLNGAA